MIVVERVINSAIIQILKANPFYGHVVCQMPKIYTQSVPTLAVGRRKGDILISLYINPKYIEDVYERAPSKQAAFTHVMEVLKHEIFHTVFRHLFIKKPNRKKLQLACELSANSYICRENLLDKGVFPKDYKLQDCLGVEEYYNLLPNDESVEDPKGPGDGNGSDDRDENSDGSSSNHSLLDSHDGWNNIAGNKSDEIILKDILRKAKESAQRCNKWGAVPGSIRDEIDKFISHEEQLISWQTALKDFIASSSENVLDYTNKRKSKRYGTRPGTKKDDVLNLAIGIDTSGSISSEDLKMFFSELYWISKSGAKITVFECDMTIGKEYPFEDLDLSKISGGGGTDLEPVIKEASKRKFDALIYFTDAFAPKIVEDYRIPVLMVVTEYNEENHIPKSELPYPCKMAFYVGKNKKIRVE